jgi:hypothetical protein
MKIVALFLLIVSTITFAEDVKKTKDGIYSQYVGMSLPAPIGGYIVDPKTQQCFFAYHAQGGVTVISCEKLAQREEWKSIITWVGKSKSE